MDFKTELSIFAKNPMNLQENLSIDTLLNFKIFDANSEVQIEAIKIRKEKGKFIVYDGGVMLAGIPDSVEFPKEYQKYIDIHKPD